MKWNNEQLELGLSNQRYLARRRRSQRRLQRATWWFDQMRKAVDEARGWDFSDQVMEANQLRSVDLSLASDRRDRIDQALDKALDQVVDG